MRRVVDVERERRRLEEQQQSGGSEFFVPDLDDAANPFDAAGDGFGDSIP